MSEFCGLWIELITVDWCQAVRVGSEWYHLKPKAQRMFTFSPLLRPITKSHDWDYDCEDPGPDPGLAMLALCRSPSAPVCVWTCVQCVISAHIPASAASPLPFIHCGQSGAWANKHPLCLEQARSFGPRVSSFAVFYLTQIFLGDNILGYIFSRLSVCDTGPPSVPQRDFCGGQKAESGSGANGYYMDPGRERGVCQDYKLGSRLPGPSRHILLDSTEWVLTILVTGLGRGSNNMRGSCLDPSEGDEFLSCDGQQWMS